MPDNSEIQQDYIKQIKLVTLGNDNEVTTKSLNVGYSNLVKVTWGQLMNLVNSNQCVPGCKYRITDYECTTTIKGTKSMGHKFDIVVNAISESEVSEEAYALPSPDDEYFSECNLRSWKIWYCLRNDTDRFEWVEARRGSGYGGKGVIYRMIDEYGNDCPYDFKNIVFGRKPISTTTKTLDVLQPDMTETPQLYRYTFDLSKVSATGECKDGTISGGTSGNVILPYCENGTYKLNNIVILGGENCYNNKFGNDCHDITFGVETYNNTIGNSCCNLLIESNFRNNNINSNFSYVLVDNDINSGRNFVDNVNFLDSTGTSLKREDITIDNTFSTWSAKHKLIGHTKSNVLTAVLI